MFRRTRAPVDPVTVYLDDSPISAERGEPLALSLLAADEVTLARSPKLHRPRGPSCLRGGCDGCLARVDGVPNVMTCLRPALGGERIETQNVIGSRRADLLRVTDWFFPQGIDHHHLLAGVPGISEVMQGFARKLAGLGRLPAEPEAEHAARRSEVDAIVIGGGPAGVVVASRVAGAGRRVALVDDALGPAGSLAGAPELARSLLGRHPLDLVEVHAGATALGVYLGEVLIAGARSATVVRARAKVFATGAHDGALGVPNNDLPCVMSARALCRVLAAAVELEGPVAIVGSGFWADRLAAALGARGEGGAVLRVDPAELVAIEGTGRARAVRVGAGRGAKKLKVAAVAIATPGAPAFELPAQAGAAIELHPDRGYFVAADEHGRAGEHLWAVGECTGADFDPGAIEARAAEVADDVIAATS